MQDIVQDLAKPFLQVVQENQNEFGLSTTVNWVSQEVREQLSESTAVLKQFREQAKMKMPKLVKTLETLTGGVESVKKKLDHIKQAEKVGFQTLTQPCTLIF